MILTLMQGKIHRARVTKTLLHYEGSIGIDAALLEGAGILPYQQVDVYDIQNGARFQTYAIVMPHGSGEITVNGAAARLVMPGDQLIIVAFAQMEAVQAKDYQPKVVCVDDNNRAIESTRSSTVDRSRGRSRTGLNV